MDELEQLKACIEHNTRWLRADYSAQPMTPCDWVCLLAQLAEGQIEKVETVVRVMHTND